jgi:hypothetical protein
MTLERFDPEDRDVFERLRLMLSPQDVERQFRKAIQICWITMEPDKQNVQEVEKHVRRIVERALHDLREDPDSFGLPPSQ